MRSDGSLNQACAYERLFESADWVKAALMKGWPRHSSCAWGRRCTTTTAAAQPQGRPQGRLRLSAAVCAVCCVLCRGPSDQRGPAPAAAHVGRWPERPTASDAGLSCPQEKQHSTCGPLLLHLAWITRAQAIDSVAGVGWSGRASGGRRRRRAPSGPTRGVAQQHAAAASEPLGANNADWF